MNHEYFDWTALIDEKARQRMCNEVGLGIKAGKFWHNSPKYQTDWNVFGSPSLEFKNLKMLLFQAQISCSCFFTFTLVLF